MLSYVLVPVDGSVQSEAVLPVAASIAGRLAVELRLVQVIDHEFERDAAEEQIGNLQAKHGAGAASVLASGNVFRTILDLLETNPGGLVAMSTHGRSRLTEEVMGSTALTLVRKLARPVLVYRPSDHEPAPPSLVPIETIVVPIDGSEFAESMIPVAAGFAKAIGAGVELVQVIEPLGNEAPADVLESSYVRTRAESLHRDTGISSTFEVLHGDSVKVIPDYVRNRPQTMLAMTTHARRGIERIAFGGVANACIRHAGVPILLRHMGNT